MASRCGGHSLADRGRDDRTVEHASQHLNLVVVAKSPLARILTFAEERGWQRVRLLSAAANGYNRDYLAETAEATQRPMFDGVPPRRRCDPPLLELGAVLRTFGARTGSTSRRHARAGLEPHRSPAGRTPDRLGGTAELHLTGSPRAIRAAGGRPTTSYRLPSEARAPPASPSRLQRKPPSSPTPAVEAHVPHPERSRIRPACHTPSESMRTRDSSPALPAASM